MTGLADFFKGQFDYPYFFYGLSFLFLALICFNWVPTNFLDYYASIQIIKDSKDRANSPAGASVTAEKVHILGKTFVKGNIPWIDATLCSGCGACMLVCRTQAIACLCYSEPRS
jgi:NAD-dependent dihydropyrimidine dehydrogenase PreA subunit